MFLLGDAVSACWLLAMWMKSRTLSFTHEKKLTDWDSEGTFFAGNLTP